MHDAFYEVKAENNFELGLKLGHIFKDDLTEAIKQKSKNKTWQARKSNSKNFLGITKKHFSNYIEELRGYAKGANVSFEDLWVLTVGAELDDITEEKCTSVFTNKGNLIGATEDCFAEVKDELYVLKKTIKNLTILELYYSYSLGGDSISINSNGYVQTINTLVHTDHQIGIPRNIIGRWLSETNNPVKDYKKLKPLKRSSGYSHTLTSKNNVIYNIELTAGKSILTKNKNLFVHTNHYLSKLRNMQAPNALTGVCTGSAERYELAINNVRSEMSVNEMKNLLTNKSKGKENSIFNERTIGRIVVDLEKKRCFIWLLREKQKSWVEYSLDFIKN